MILEDFPRHIFSKRVCRRVASRRVVFLREVRARAAVRRDFRFVTPPPPDLEARFVVSRTRLRMIIAVR